MEITRQEQLYLNRLALINEQIKKLENSKVILRENYEAEKEAIEQIDNELNKDV